MKFPIIICPWLPVNGMALYPFILIRKRTKDDEGQLILHERIHLRQQAELLILPFYFFYLFNYLCNLLKYRDHHLAYINIVFEREAYHNHHHQAYLEQRRLWAFLSYF